MSAFPKPYADRVAKLRVPFGFVLVITFAWLSQPSPGSMTIGLPVAALGLLLRGWAAGHLEKNLRLAQGGPYAYVRNPLYIGTLLVAMGLVIAARRWLLALIFAAVFLLVYLPVIELEEQHLRQLFPVFRDYELRVPALLPTLKPLRMKESFRWQLYVRNREYQALGGMIAGVMFLLGKMLLWQE